jgi:hypothetical protein
MSLDSVRLDAVNMGIFFLQAISGCIPDMIEIPNATSHAF